MRIRTSTFWKTPALIITLLSNLFTLDPSVLFKKHTLYVLKDRKRVYGFIAVKYHARNVIERGSLYVYPSFRKKGYGKKLMRHVLKKHKQLYVLCKVSDKALKEKQGFHLIRNPPTPLAWRRTFYNTYIKPVTDKEILVMKR